MQAQVRIVSALCVLHNILIDLNEVADTEEVDDQDIEDNHIEEDLDPGQHNEHGYHISRSETARAKARRDAIALAMWQDYIS